MSEVFITRRGGGGGAGLNFKIVNGTTQPTSPGENTIWVNTPTEITGYVFSATQPESPTAGTVWISTGASSPVAFNAMKKNGLWVYPQTCHQYINDTWTTKTAKTYQDGTWVDWVTYLYATGNEYESLTGGWSGVSAGFGQDVGIMPTVTKGASAITAEITTKYRSGQLITANSIDLSNYNTLSFNVAVLVAGGESENDYCPWVGVFSQKGGSYNKTAIARAFATTTGIIDVDISNVTAGYVGVGLYYNNDVGKSSITLSAVYCS